MADNDKGNSPPSEPASAVGYLGGPPQKAPGETPHGGYTEEQMAYINRKRGGYANPGSPLWAYREKIAEGERKNLPHEQEKLRASHGAARKSARGNAVNTVVGLACVVGGILPSIPDLVRWLVLSLAGTLAAFATLGYLFWAPEHTQRCRLILGLAATVTVILMWPFAHFIGSLGAPTVQPAVTAKNSIRPNGQRRNATNSNRDVREPSQAPFSSRKR